MSGVKRNVISGWLLGDVANPKPISLLSPRTIKGRAD